MVASTTALTERVTAVEVAAVVGDVPPVTAPDVAQGRLDALEVRLVALAGELQSTSRATMGFVSDHSIAEAKAEAKLAALSETCEWLARAVHGYEVMCGGAAAKVCEGKEVRPQDAAEALENVPRLKEQVEGMDISLNELSDHVKELMYATRRHAARTAERLDDLERITAASPSSPIRGQRRQGTEEFTLRSTNEEFLSRSSNEASTLPGPPAPAAAGAGVATAAAGAVAAALQATRARPARLAAVEGEGVENTTQK